MTILFKFNLFQVHLLVGALVDAPLDAVLAAGGELVRVLGVGNVRPDRRISPSVSHRAVGVLLAAAQQLRQGHGATEQPVLRRYFSDTINNC